MTGPRPAVFLDRDGTLNVAELRAGLPHPPATVAEFALLPGVAEGCRRLRAAGYVLVVVTNQPDVGRGEQTVANVEAMHRRLRDLLPIEHIEVCYDSGRGEDSEFRKPRPGMILKAARELNLDLSRSWMIGDRWRDVDCGVNAAVRTVFIDFHYAEQLRAQPTLRVADFPAAVVAILST